MPSRTALRPPWQERQLPHRLKLLVTVVVALLAFVAFVFGFTWLMIVPQMLIKGPGPRDTIDSMIMVGLVLSGGLLVFGGATALLWPLVTAQMSFSPSYAAVPATTIKHPFEARFRRAIWARSVSGTGTISFESTGLTVSGYLTPSRLLQLVVLIVFTVVPLLVFGVGLGLIPALLLAHYLGRKRIVTTLPYEQLREVTVRGCRVCVKASGTPEQISFAVASVDGERLYRELLPHVPAALKGWSD
jgi:hypothetical protein